MRKMIISVATIAIVTITNAQPVQPGCYPFPKTISVTGSAEMDITPDEIYVQINLREYKKKGENKTELDKIKADFLANCKLIDIPDSNISVASYDGNDLSFIWRRRKKDPDLFLAIVYQIKFSNTKKIDELVDKLDDEATSNFSITHTSHSKITEYRKKLKIMAVKAAREKAAYLCESVNEQLGQAITIEEPEESANSDAHSENFKTNNVFQKERLDGNDKDINSIGYRKIKLRFEVKVLYALK